MSTSSTGSLSTIKGDRSHLSPIIIIKSDFLFNTKCASQIEILFLSRLITEK